VSEFTLTRFRNPQREDPENRSPYHQGHSRPKVAALIAVLEQAYRDLQSGVWWGPEGRPRFPLRHAWETAAGREALISFLDSEFSYELGHWEGWGSHGITDHPSFYRLPDPMRIALCQRLHAVIERWGDGPGPACDRTLDEACPRHVCDCALEGARPAPEHPVEAWC